MNYELSLEDVKLILEGLEYANYMREIGTSDFTHIIVKMKKIKEEWEKYPLPHTTITCPYKDCKYNNNYYCRKPTITLVLKNNFSLNLECSDYNIGD